ncbi:MAG: 2-dehydro-3-deoxygalactonokinase [Alphaproteobacteria bacterium]|nr:2-dehydro-3-deoxygalactonokinase [Alphaproteobacteria bacterium]
MGHSIFIVGDWGTSRLRLFLCDGGKTLETLEGPGIGKLSASPEETLFELIAPWQEQYGKSPITLTGMVGSNIGWQNVPYKHCPADASGLNGASAHFTARGTEIEIIAGLTCTNALGSPDVMRGEETQVFGAMHLHGELRTGRHLVCLPGTHTKWAVLDEGAITHFHTAPVGEFFDILTKHSVLAKDAGPITAVEPDAFIAGARKGLEATQPGLMHYLFETRSKQITGEFTAHQAGSWLSGLLIGHDVAGGRAIYGEDCAVGSITLIGTEALAALYLDVFDLAGLDGVAISGGATVVAGLRLLRSKETADAGL